MLFKQTTQVPNILFDKYLPKLTDSELRVLLVIIRQTYGWVNQKTGKRKARDRISHGQFMTKAGLSRRVISKTLKTLIGKGLIDITDSRGQPLRRAGDRRGKLFLYYALTYAPGDTNMCTQRQEPVHESAYNKTNYPKLIKTKLREASPKRAGRFMMIKEALKAAGYWVRDKSS